jgi:uncharacterized membrane protein
MKAPLLRHPAHLPDALQDEPSDDERAYVSESRWPMAGAVLAAITLTVLLPDSIRLGPAWLLPALEGLLLIALVAADPGQITRRSRVLRVLAIGLVLLLAFSSLVSAGLLIDELISGGATTNEAGPLLAAGVSVWTGNALAFTLLFWELDGGGPATRARALPGYPDFAFPQQSNPSLAPPNWRPRFVDYLYLSLTNSIAFSPTDTMPLIPWAKLSMGLQSLVSFAIVGLVIARAVNVFS